MKPTVESVLQAALELSQIQRIALVSRLMESLPETAANFEDRDFQKELERRFGDPANTVPWRQVRDAL